MINVALPALVIFFGVAGLSAHSQPLMLVALGVSFVQLCWFGYWWFKQ